MFNTNYIYEKKNIMINYTNDMYRIIFNLGIFIINLFTDYYIEINKIIFNNNNIHEIDYEISNEYNQTINNVIQIEPIEPIEFQSIEIFYTKILFDNKIIDYAISDVVNIVKNIVNNYKITNTYNPDNANNMITDNANNMITDNLDNPDNANNMIIDNLDNPDNANNAYNIKLNSNKIINKDLTELINKNSCCLNTIKKKIVKSELSNIINNLDNDELNNLKNELLNSIINIANNLQINDNKTFRKYIKILFKNDILDNDILENDNISDNDNILDDISDDDDILNDISDNDISDDDILNNNNLYKINEYNNMGYYIDKNVKVSNIIELIDEIKI